MPKYKIPQKEIDKRNKEISLCIVAHYTNKKGFLDPKFVSDTTLARRFGLDNVKMAGFLKILDDLAAEGKIEKIT